MNTHFMALLDDYHLLNSHYRDLQIQYQDLKRDYEKLTNRLVSRKNTVLSGHKSLVQMQKGLSGLYGQIRLHFKPTDPLCASAQVLNELPISDCIRLLLYLESLITIYE